MKKYLLILLGFAFLPTHGQVISFSGKVLSMENDSPIPFAHIAIQNQSIGTISDENGDFKLQVDKSEIANHSLIISSVGYQSITISKSDSWDKIIRLKPLISELNEVVVTGKKSNLSPKKLVQSALKAASKIDRKTPIILDIEQTSHCNQVLTKYYLNEEATITRKESISWNTDISEKYKGSEEYSLDVDALITSSYIFAPEELLKTDIYSIPKLKKGKGKYSYEFTGMAKVDGESTFEISVLQKEDTSIVTNDYKFYISVDDLSLRKLDRKEQIAFSVGNHHIYALEHTTSIYDHALEGDPIREIRIEYVEFITRYNRNREKIRVDHKKDVISGYRTKNYQHYDYNSDEKYSSTIDALNKNIQEDKMYLFLFIEPDDNTILKERDPLFQILKDYTIDDIEIICLTSGKSKSKWKHDASAYPFFSHYFLNNPALLQSDPLKTIYLYDGSTLLLSSQSVSDKILREIKKRVGSI